MEWSKYLIPDKGTRVCQSCFHRRYYRKRFVQKPKEERKYTFEDLRRHLEKDWD